MFCIRFGAVGGARIGGQKMANEKLRVGGMTIETTKTYSGAVVLQLLKTSFENGCRNGRADSHKEFIRGYEAGLVDGKETAARTLEKLREALYEVFECGAKMDGERKDNGTREIG
jgi:hypothetical protein